MPGNEQYTPTFVTGDRVLVVGGGVAGIKAALECAEIFKTSA